VPYNILRLRFEDLFSSRIRQLMHSFPLDKLTSSGTPFWSGAKKPPSPLLFDPADPLHLEFILAVSVITIRR
jgi:ubiquitin-activating enzyme E1